MLCGSGVMHCVAVVTYVMWQWYQGACGSGDMRHVAVVTCVMRQ